MSKFRHLGYYNYEDAIDTNEMCPDDVVKHMQDGMGNFITDDSSDTYTEDDFEGHYYRYTTDNKYVVMYDVADIILDNGENEFVDIYQKI